MASSPSPADVSLAAQSAAVRRPDCVQHGVLLKQSDFMKLWRERYFVLFKDPPRLSYYYAGKETQPIKVYALDGARIQQLPVSGKRSGFSVLLSTSSEVLFLASDTPTVTAAWWRALSTLLAPPPVLTAEVTGPAPPHGKTQRRGVQSSPFHAVEPLVQRLAKVQPIDASAYGSAGAFLHAAEEGLVVVCFPQSKGGTALDLALAPGALTRARDGVRLTSELVLDGARCRFTGELDLETLKGTGCLKPVV